MSAQVSSVPRIDTAWRELTIMVSLYLPQSEDLLLLKT